ncbi:uncharacterized protein METZ01_LOCUS172547 [marine metagenome]|uniref:Uncharacterized protein n=1 Tax=marine metagenome TaxID=408172 RepID=A0A382C301_9ZZZZ
MGTALTSSVYTDFREKGVVIILQLNHAM